ncbi:MAG: glycosyltransferase family 4 protein [Mariprofundus sp.]|nr:glycosyltransferase family 4 protein [Mariprofundus sp.]
MKILIVSHYFWPEQFRINDLTLALQAQGHDVSVLTGMPNYPTGTAFDGYSWRKKRHDILNGVPVYRVPMFLRRQGRGWQLALNYFSFVFFGCLLAPWYFRKQDFDIIFVYEPSPFTVGIPALLMRWLKKAPMLFWVQDLWPESLQAAGAVKSPAVLKVVGSMVRWIYSHCDRVLVQSQSFIEPAVQAGAVRENTLYYPNWAESFYCPLPPSEVGWGNVSMPVGFRIVFAGNLGEAQSLETIVSAAIRLKHEADIQWVIIGDGRKADWMRSEVEKQGLAGSVSFLGSHQAEDMPIFFASADALLVTLKADEVFAQTIPSKVQTYLACGRPIVAALNGEGAKVIRSTGAGLVVAAEDDEALADAVLALYRMSENELIEMGHSARICYEAEFERDMLIKRLEGWMQQLLEERK